MKKHILTFAVLSIACVSTTGFAQTSGTSTGSNPPKVIVVKQPKPGKGRPKIPSNQSITFSYDGIHSQGLFDFGTQEATCLSVEIENQTTGELHYGNVDATYPVMDVYLTPAPYTITCTSDDGSIYAGDFEVF